MASEGTRAYLDRQGEVVWARSVRSALLDGYVSRQTIVFYAGVKGDRASSRTTTTNRRRTGARTTSCSTWSSLTGTLTRLRAFLGSYCVNSRNKTETTTRGYAFGSYCNSLYLFRLLNNTYAFFVLIQNDYAF